MSVFCWFATRVVRLDEERSRYVVVEVVIGVWPLGTASIGTSLVRTERPSMSSYRPTGNRYTAIPSLQTDCSLVVGEVMSKVLLVQAQSTIVAIGVVVSSPQLFVERRTGCRVSSESTEHVGRHREERRSLSRVASDRKRVVS